MPTMRRSSCWIDVGLRSAFSERAELIVVVAFDRGRDRELFTGYGPTDQQSEERVIRIAKALASKHVGVIA